MIIKSNDIYINIFRKTDIFIYFFLNEEEEKTIIRQTKQNCYLFISSYFKLQLLFIILNYIGSLVAWEVVAWDAALTYERQKY